VRLRQFKLGRFDFRKDAPAALEEQAPSAVSVMLRVLR
jgi:hypothetical protein